MITTSNFRVRKNGQPYSQCYCRCPELIENYEKAIVDNVNVWHCHHKKEEFYTQQELIDLGLYYNVPPEDLVFVKDSKDHYSWPHKGREIGWEKATKSKIGHICTSKTRELLCKKARNRIRVKCIETNQIFDSINSACRYFGLKSNIGLKHALKDSNRVSAGYHWSLV